MKLLQPLLRSLAYFRAGFNYYINFPIGLIGFGTSFYYLAIQNIPPLKQLFPGFIEFMIALIFIIYPIGHIAGVLHFKKLLFKTEQDILTESNQYSQNILAPIFVPMYQFMLELGQKEGMNPETIKQFEDILRATSDKTPPYRGDPMKRRIKRVKNFAARLGRIFTPRGIQWENTQRDYEKWADTPLPEDYLEMVKRRGADFREFVGTPGTIIDVGCGNGLLSGKPYAETGYVPLKRGVHTIYGLDPLELKAPIPWIDEFIRGRCEDPIPVKAEYAAFATSFDHLEDSALSLSRLVDAGVRGIFIWETLMRRRMGGDSAHLKRYTLEELTAVLDCAGFSIKRFVVTDDMKDSYWCFVEAEKR